LRPFLELTLAVVTALPACSRVEAHEREVGRRLVRLERVHLRPVTDHQRDAMLTKQRVDVLVEPARVAELERVTLLLRKPLERVRQPRVVAPEVRRKLPEDRAELRRADQRIDARGEALQ